MAVELKIVNNIAVLLIGKPISDDWENIALKTLNEWKKQKIKRAYYCSLVSILSNK